MLSLCSILNSNNLRCKVTSSMTLNSATLFWHCKNVRQSVNDTITHGGSNIIFGEGYWTFDMIHSFDGYLRSELRPNKNQLKGARRCNNCERWHKKEGLGDFVCKHMKGYKEAPARVKRCYDCNEWKNDNFIKGDFWCKHNKYR